MMELTTLFHAPIGNLHGSQEDFRGNIYGESEGKAVRNAPVSVHGMGGK